LAVVAAGQGEIPPQRLLAVMEDQALLLSNTLKEVSLNQPTMELSSLTRPIG